MKKNKMMRLASAMMVLTLMSTSVISGTFAKYVTSDSASDSARVAKWGITVLASGSLFGTDYSKYESDNTGDRIVAATSASVSSLTTDNVVAPGTMNTEGFKIFIDGQPEVAYSITATNNEVTVEDIFLKDGSWGVMVKAHGLNDASDVKGYYSSTDGQIFTEVVESKWESTATYYELHDAVTLDKTYYPIVWTVKKEGSDFEDITADSNLVSISEAMLTNIAGTFNAEHDATASYVLTWEWPFDETKNARSNDGADTILGNLRAKAVGDFAGIIVKHDGTNYTTTMADGTDYNLDVNFGLAVTVTQID